MAIDNIYLNYLAPLLNEFGGGRSLRIACLSYPDLLLRPADVAKAFPTLDEAKLQIRSDSDRICAWHGIKQPIEVTDTLSLLSALGHTVDFLDMKAFRGVEKIVDLNLPLPDDFVGCYDLVVDTGTLEHCFNVGTAFVGMCRLLADGGYILTQAPLNKVNHGFWNFSPCVYANFFVQNNWEVKYLLGYFTEGGKVTVFKPSHNGRFAAPCESVVIACAKKVRGASYDFPTQQKYLST